MPKFLFETFCGNFKNCNLLHVKCQIVKSYIKHFAIQNVKSAFKMPDFVHKIDPWSSLTRGYFYWLALLFIAILNIQKQCLTIMKRIAFIIFGMSDCYV